VMHSSEQNLTRVFKIGVTLTGLAILFWIGRNNYLLFHTIVELFSITITFSVFTLTWNSRPYLKNGYLLFIGFGGLFVGAIDLLHTLAYQGMGVFPGGNANLPTQLWLAQRLVLSLSFLLAPFFLKGRFQTTWVLLGFSAITALLIFSIFQWGVFPAAYINGSGLTPFKIYSEYGIILIFLGSILLLYRTRQAFDREVLYLLVFSIAASVLAEMAFIFYGSVDDLINMTGHYLVILSFFLVYKAMIETGLVRPYRTIFRELKMSEEALRRSQIHLEEQVLKRTQELNAANADLRNEIDERAQAEQALEEQRVLLETVLKQAANGIVICDSDGKLTFANAAARRMAGISEEIQPDLAPYYGGQAYNPNRSMIFLEDDALPKALSGEIVLGREQHLVRNDGNFYDVISSAAPLVRNDGTVMGAVMVFADITLRKRAEEALQKMNQELEVRVVERTTELQQVNENLAHELEERKQMEKALLASQIRLLRLFNSNVIGIMFSHEDGWILNANDALLQVIGYNREDMEAGNVRWLDMTPPEYLALDARGIEEARKNGACAPYEKEFFRKDGGRVPILIGYASLEDSPGEFVCFVIDLTVQKKAEAEVQHYNQQLERSNRELQEFAYVASHDLQEPLRKILAFGDRLQTSAADKLDERELDYLSRMQKASTRMRTMINDLLALSRITTKAQPFAPVDLNQIAGEVLLDMEVHVEQTGAQVEIGPLPIIEADPLQMRQLLQNLIGNALKFINPGERPHIRVMVESPSSRSNDSNQARILVADNGIGFEEQYLERIFQPFQRLHGMGTYDGSGMGLAIVQKIVQRHQGSITAYSVVGEGTTFVVTLPIKQNS
jgi:PAS domain S-box-containing protein